MPKMYPELSSAQYINKLSHPILTKDDMPFDASLIFNAGVAKWHGKYVMVFRNDYGTDEDGWTNKNGRLGTSVAVAFSDNGIDGWQVRKLPLFDSRDLKGEIRRFYDPRITIIDQKPYLCMAMDTNHGIRGCIAEVDDNFENVRIISTSTPDNRNMVLFPEKINGMYVRLERPFTVYSRGRDRFDIWISKSPDLKFWGESELVLGVEHVPFANDKIGPAAPPIKTHAGWLTTFHAVDIDHSRGKNGWEQSWKKRYCAGIMLLDLEDPSKVIGMCKDPLIAPELSFETDIGFRQNVIFPGGMIAEDDGNVKIYYGASDTVECLATANIDDLISLCTAKK